MATELLERPVAKEKKNDTSIRIDRESAEKIGNVANLKGLTLAEYIRASFMPIVERDLLAEAKKIVKREKGGSSE